MATKTNAVRLVQQAGIPCREAFYEFDEQDLSGGHAAQAIGMPEEQVFKTLVARGEKTGINVFCIPVCCELDLKKAARAAGVEAFDTPFTDVNDDGGLWEDARYAKSLGFTGKAAISPRHLDAINRCFSPSQAETDYAREVLAAIEDAKRCGKGAVALRGKMIDAPIAARARQTLAAAEEILAEGGTLQ